ncbi:MAG: histidine kinase dimerization/phospho-acceptor domain-containing protein, partial [Anaerolineae bacterium]
MLKSLRSRLLASYLFLIGAVLMVTAVILFLVVTRPAVRYLPTLTKLTAVSRSNRAHLNQLREVDARPATIEEMLTRIADDNEVRLLLVNAGNGRILFDSADEWTGTAASDIDQSVQRLFPDLETNAVLGRYRAPDRSRWLVYGPGTALPFNARTRLFYAAPEPTALGFFRDSFFRPLVFTGMVALVLAVILALLVARSVGKPLRQLADGAAAIAEGHYDQQIRPSGPEEVQRVAQSFNSMAARVKMTHQSQRDLVANVSHDLKTPLTSIQGWSQALLDGTAVTPTEQERAAKIIHNEADRMSRMVSQLLDLARIESGTLQLAQEPVNIAELLAEVRHNLTLRTQTLNIHLTLNAEPVPPVIGDYDRLMQVFTNLADNALTHTPAGGRVHLTVKRHGEKAVEVSV